MIDFLITGLLAAHLVCVNVASGGPIVGAWLDWLGTRGEEAAAKAAVYLARWSVLGLVLGAILGLAMGWLKWDAEYCALWLGPLSYKMHWAVVEAVFSLVLLLGWWFWLPGKAGASGRAMIMRGIIAVLSATNLLYHFPVLFSVAAKLADAGETSGAVISGAAFRRLMIAGETPALAVHVVLASVAMAGILLFGLSLRWLRREDVVAAEKVARWGARWALATSLAQLPVGVWLLFALPVAAQSRLMGEITTGVILFVLAILVALWLINELVHVSGGETSRSRLIRAMTAMMITVVLMSALLEQIRSN
jgi:hypothetical protein